MYDIDIDTLTEWAEKALERPGDAAFWDDRLYTTHGSTLTWAERGDDILEESNYLSALDIVKGAAEDEDDVIDATCGHWLVGSLRQLFVRVYDDEGNFTAAWKAIVEIGEGLEGYPIVDESDYSEREWKLYEENLSEALDDAQRAYDLDTDEESQAIRDAFYDVQGDRLPWDGADVSWDAVAELYREVRDEFFTELVLGVHPDQLQLDIAV
ncbi:hypothetical protein [Streptomyces phage phiScoe3]|nr:hypothetical protein [Streptomyces phage phiScoe3]